MLRLGTLVLALGVAGCGGDDEPSVMDASTLTARLASAGAGATVTVGVTTFEGSFHVPAGVTVVGAGRGATRIRAPVGEPAFVLAAGSTLRALSVEGAGGRAIDGDGGGSDDSSVTVEQVDVTVTTGQAIGLSNFAIVTLRNVEIAGPVTAERATEVTPGAGPDVTATHGLILSGIGRRDAPAALSEVSIRGIARFGMLFIESFVATESATLIENLGTAVMVHGGRLDASHVTVTGTLQGVQPLPAYALVVAADAEVSTEDLELSDNEGYGVVQDGGVVSHRRPLVTGNNEAGIWAQRDAALEIVGVGSELLDNRLAGVVVVSPTRFLVENALVAGTRTAPRIVGEVGEIRVGDGIHAIAEDADGLSFSDVSLERNERVGLLLDLQADTASPAMFERVTVDAPDDGFGAVAQTPSGPLDLDEWGAAIERMGNAPSADAAVADRFDVVGLIAPMFLPRSE